MLALRTFLALILSGFLASPLLAAETPERETLEKAIPYGIGLLEAKNYKGFIEDFMAPDQLKFISQQGSMDKFVDEIFKNAAPDILTVMKKMKDLKPKLDEKGTGATYTLPEAVKGKTDFKFQKIGKYWYMGN